MNNYSGNVKLLCLQLIMITMAASLAPGQVPTLNGYVRNMTGVPIEGAEVTLKNLGETRRTNEEGYYDFSQTVVVQEPEYRSFNLKASSHSLLLNLQNESAVTVGIYGLKGTLVLTLAQHTHLPAGSHLFSLDKQKFPHPLYIIRIKINSDKVIYRFMSYSNGFLAVSRTPSKGDIFDPMTKISLAADSVIVTHPDYYGGLNNLNRAEVDDLNMTLNFRMFESDPAWRDRCAPDLNWNFDDSEGSLYFQELLGDPTETEQEVLVEVCQSIFRDPEEPRQCNGYTGNVNRSVGTGVASTGGCTLNFNVNYINNQKGRGDEGAWYEIVGVLVHEAVHTYQPYYQTEGASGFGEAMPDAVRRLTGFFKWDACNGGSFASNYQTGGRFWHFIEKNIHPGFIYEIWQNPSGNIRDRVLDITGRDIDELWDECSNFKGVTVKGS